MKFNLIICTYNRKASLERLLDSVRMQVLYPKEILVIDSSSNLETEQLFAGRKYEGLKYFKVNKEERGLTRQRNFGITKTQKDIEVICFLDDDIIIEPDYFKNLISTYSKHKDAIAVGGWIKDGTIWWKGVDPAFDEFEFDGFIRKLGSRNVFRKKLGLLSDKPPGIMPVFSHGFSTGFLPPSGRIYPVEYFMGGVASYRKEIFSKIKFSSYFQGYGLYEDMDFCLRASKIGKLYVNTSARVEHLHDESGRPDHYRYGKMVTENGYYVWKLKYPQPDLTSKLKHFSIDVILMGLRFINGLRGDGSGFHDAKGRLAGLWRVIFKQIRRGEN